MIYEIEKELLSTTFGSRSYSRSFFKELIEVVSSKDISQVLLDTVASSIANGQPLTSTARKVSTRLHNKIEKELPNDHSLLKSGCEFINIMLSLSLIDVNKHQVIEKGKVKDQWFIISLSKELTDYASSLHPAKSMLSPTEGVRLWKRPVYRTDSHRIPIVKKADRYDLLDYYEYDRMPLVYKALNRLNSQSFRINERLLSFILTTPSFQFLIEPISELQRQEAMMSINDISRKAKIIEEIQFKEMNKWLVDVEVEDEGLRAAISKKKASEKSQDYYDTKVEPHINIISQWSKNIDQEKIIRLAKDWLHKDIFFLFNCDTRGRIYSVQNYLTPLGSDLAKAMLVFGEEIQVSGYDLCIHIANCFGQDKLSFEERVEWVNENSERLRAIGSNPSNNYSYITELDLEGESKTRWQGITACMVYADYCDYIETYGTEEGFTTSLIIGLDATASGTQLLSIFGRDDKVAPYVNITSSPTGRVGDFYTYLSNFLQPKLESHRGSSETLDALLDNWKKVARKLSKRNSMTFSYSGTKFGFGEQHWEDRHSYGPLGSALTRSDCRIIGNEMYDVCVENIRGGAGVMQWLREGVDYHKGGSLISWTLPDGFRAFQVCDKGKRSQISVEMGDKKINLIYYIDIDKPAVAEHKNAIAPNWVHSYDSYLLREIVRTLPEEAQVSTVHDQFSTSSYYIQELQEVAKEAYKKVGCRKEAERTCEEAFGTYRPLPLVGTYELDEIDNAEFIIC